tara:strand:+ start:149 stop:1393 length:1245 start_codon:yes stop_codon:yes gene_type:complete
MKNLFTSESVSEGHPDKLSDQISDSLLDNILAFDPDAKVAIETFVTTNRVIVGGETNTSFEINYLDIVRDVIKNVGYSKKEYKFDYKSCKISNYIHSQSQDINRGVDKKNKKEQGAGDQGMMFGYAINETENFMPLALDLSHKLLEELSFIRKEYNKMKYLRPDSKSQVTVEYKNGVPFRINTIVLSTQHDEFDLDEKMLDKIKTDIKDILIPRIINKYPFYSKYFNNEIIYHINPTGKFVIGGPHGDTGLTGRKIIVDTYGGKGAHGGGAFSGKDPSKVDRSAAYATRHIAKNICAAGLANEVLVQVSYAIGISEPVGLFVNTFGTSKGNLNDSEISNYIYKNIDLSPFAIEDRLKLRNPIYSETSSYGHMGRDSVKTSKKFYDINLTPKTKEVELFTWEKLDLVNQFKNYLL